MPETTIQPQAIQTSESAFQAEGRQQYDEAAKLHAEAATALEAFAASDAKPEAKAAAERQAKVHHARVEALKGVRAGQVPAQLPSSRSANVVLQAVDEGKFPLTVEEMWLANYKTDKTAEVNPAMAHLTTGSPNPFAPTLDESAEPITFDVSFEDKAVGDDQHVYYYDVTAPGSSTASYTLRAPKKTGFQIAQTALYRVSEAGEPVVSIAVASVPAQNYAEGSDAFVGRDLRVAPAWTHPIDEKMDRQGRAGWGHRRFSYAGRQFVWLDGTKTTDPQTLVEVESVFPKQGSKTGKMDHTAVGPKLASGHAVFKGGKVATIQIAAGVDQLFVEYILASSLTQMAVLQHSHSN